MFSKKCIFSLLAVSVLVSCTSTIDKKIVLTEYGDNIKEIKESHKEYTAEDFTTASKKLDKRSFKAMSSGNMELEISYKELLEEAKAENLKNKKIEEEFQVKLNKLRQVLKVEVLEGKYKPLDDISIGMKGYEMDIAVTNTSKKAIAGAKGSILVFNSKNELLVTFPMNLDDKFPADAKREAEVVNILDDTDNIFELKAMPFSKLKYEWRPSKIILEDGETLEAIK